MQAEDQVPIAGRYLRLATRLSPKQFSHEKASALEWCVQNADRLRDSDRVALDDLNGFELGENACAFILYSCYADIPPGRAYDVIFNLADVSLGEHTVARLRFAIFWRHLPILNLVDGHHHLAVFDFPNGVPEIVDTLPVGIVEAPEKLGLCDAATWDAIREQNLNA